MIRGDISNEIPPRIIVFIDVVVNSEVVEERKLLVKHSVRKITSLNNLNLSHLWNVANKYGLSVELAATEEDGWTQEHLDHLMDRVERRGGNPFNYSELYPTLQEFIDDMPYRYNLKGIIDLPFRVARYGSFGIELQNL